MESVTEAKLRSLLQRLSERYTGPGSLYLLGGCALCLLGSPRETQDIDYSAEVDSESMERFETVLAELAAEMHLDLEPVPLGEFIPLPPQAYERRKFVGRYGQLDVYIFDLYSIALSKIARGFEADLEDVTFMLQRGFVDFQVLESHFNAILPGVLDFDIAPSEFRTYFEEIRRRM